MKCDFGTSSSSISQSGVIFGPVKTKVVAWPDALGEIKIVTATKVGDTVNKVKYTKALSLYCHSNYGMPLWRKGDAQTEMSPCNPS